MFAKMQEKLRELGNAPIFFVGSGISKRYIKSPNWVGLLQEVAETKNINFTKLVQKYTDNQGVIHNEQLAQELEDIYFDKLDDCEIEVGKSKPYYFRKRIAEITEKYLQDNLNLLDSNKEIEELKKTRPAAIITTNYDRLMETVYGDDYSTLVGQNSLLENTVNGIGEIYKIHGCVSFPNSIVITEEDYQNFYDKNIYLNAKLLTLFLEYPIIFLGYSMSDKDVVSILSTIYKMLSASKIEELKSRMWFIKRGDKDVKTTARINLNDGHYMDIETFILSDYSKLYSAINDISIKRLPIKFLKFLKTNVYELVASQEYNPRLLNVNIEDIENIKNFNDVSQFVGLTFSTDKNIGFCNNTNICNAFLYNDKSVKYDENDLLQYRAKNIVPFYKFISDLSMEQMMKYITKNQVNFYNQIINDDINYVINIGKKQNVDYKGEVTKESIIEYAELFVKENKLQSNQKNTVIRYVILQLINQNIKYILENDFFINDYQDELVKVMTHLSNDYIRDNQTDIFNILYALNMEEICTGTYHEHNYRFLLCLIDRAVYRTVNQ